MRRFGPFAVALLLAVGLVSGCSGTANKASNAVNSAVDGATSPAGNAGSVTGAATTPVPAATSTSAADACPSNSTKAFAKTKFALHVGLTAGIFHRWIYTPFKNGTFKSGAHGRTAAVAKALVSAPIIFHEVKEATENVKADPALCKVLLKPLTILGTQLGELKSRIAKGDTSGLEAINAGVGLITSTSEASGIAITERTDANLDKG